MKALGIGNLIFEFLHILKFWLTCYTFYIHVIWQ